MKKIKGGILAEGEVTGHSHRVDVDVFETDEKTRVFDVKDKTIVKHEEHKEIEIPQGEYESDRVVEYDHFNEEARRVAD